eukprot:Nk52_evm1s976 gene=Nk52_evmTU1s976
MADYLKENETVQQFVIPGMDTTGTPTSIFTENKAGAGKGETFVADSREADDPSSWGPTYETNMIATSNQDPDVVEAMVVRSGFTPKCWHCGEPHFLDACPNVRG